MKTIVGIILRVVIAKEIDNSLNKLEFFSFPWSSIKDLTNSLTLTKIDDVPSDKRSYKKINKVYLCRFNNDHKKENIFMTKERFYCDISEPNKQKKVKDDLLTYDWLENDHGKNYIYPFFFWPIQEYKDNNGETIECKVQALFLFRNKNINVKFHENKEFDCENWKYGTNSSSREKNSYGSEEKIFGKQNSEISDIESAKFNEKIRSDHKHFDNYSNLKTGTNDNKKKNIHKAYKNRQLEDITAVVQNTLISQINKENKNQISNEDHKKNNNTSSLGFQKQDQTINKEISKGKTTINTKTLKGPISSESDQKNNQGNKNKEIEDINDKQELQEINQNSDEELLQKKIYLKNQAKGPSMNNVFPDQSIEYNKKTTSSNNLLEQTQHNEVKFKIRESINNVSAIIQKQII